MDYKDFVLQLDRAAAQSGFVARVLHSPAGEAEAPFINPLSQEDLDTLWQTAHRTRQAARASRDCSMRSRVPFSEIRLEEIGDRLFRALFRGSVRSCWMRSFSEATRHSGGGLRLKLQLDLADQLIASLAELPWEYLFSPEHGGFLSLQRKSPILRHMRLPLPGSRPLPTRPIRVLTVLSQPATMTQLFLKEEADKIAASLKVLSGVEVLPLYNPTVEILREHLLRQNFQILHFMGHGGFDERSGQGVVYFVGAHGAPVPISGPLLATHLSGMDSLRLVFVNSCETARSNTAAPFAGVATALLRAGLPAVIAMQRPILDESALEFSRTVYRRLAVGDPIDAAVTEGRLAIFRDHGAPLEWGTPVLFSRAENGRLFSSDAPDVQPITAQPEQAATVSSGSAARSSPMTVGTRRRLVLGILLGMGISAAVWLWPLSSHERMRMDQPSVTATPTPLPAKPPKPQDETPVQQTTSIVTTPPDSKHVPKREPDRSVPSAYTISHGDSVRISGLEAEVGAHFFEREGYSFARFSVSPKGLGMLQQPAVMATGTIKFPAENGTYHLDVLGLDKVEKNATVRLRFEPTPSAPEASPTDAL